MGSTVRSALLAVSAALALLGAPAPSSAQIRLQAVPGVAVKGASYKEGPSAMVDTNKRLQDRLRKAKESLESDEFGAAIEFLQERILDRNDDFFVDQNLRGSLRDEARKALEGMTAEQRRQYDLRYAETARQLLAQAKSDQDLEGLAAVARRYFLTDAGAEAAYLLGSAHLDRGRPLQAALQLERIPAALARRWEPALSLKSALSWRLAGLPDRARQSLVAAKQSFPQARFDLGERAVSWFDKDDAALAWLDQVVRANAVRPPRAAAEESWTLPRGEAARNGSAAEVSPLWRPLWTASTLSREESAEAASTRKARDELRQLQTTHRGTSFLAIPAAMPVAAVDVVPPVLPRALAAESGSLDVVVFRTLANVRAVHLGTGRTLWESIQVDPAYERVVEGDLASAPGNGQQLGPLQSFLIQRAWRDVTAGTLSTDGERVYSVEDVGFLSSMQAYFNPRVMQSPLAPGDSNRLVAIELSTGRLLWEVGGPRTGRELPLAGTFFLGSPLPLDGRLYVIGENSGEITLFALDAETGTPQWSQSLVIPDANIEQLPVRRMVGLSPAEWNGILVCPTDGGVAVAFDLSSRRLLWGSRYAAAPPAGRMNPQLAWQINAQRANQPTADDEARWLDTTPVIAEGRVVLTPRDSDELLCLRLLDGELEWKRPRLQSLHIAAVHDGNVVVVGRSQVEALRLANAERTAADVPPSPKPGWHEPTPIAMPSGRGVRCGGVYHIPLSTGEIATLDLKTGRLVSRSKTRDRVPAGNLIAVRGALISQTVDSITALDGLENVETQIASSLTANADDAEALSIRGELRLHRGQEAAALADLRRAIGVDPKSSARPVLVAALLEGLRHDFAAHRGFSNEIEGLVDDPVQRNEFLRLTAAGLQRVGERQAAFGQYLKLIGPEAVAPTLERLSGDLSVRSDRWVRARLGEIVVSSSADERRAFDDMVRGRLDEILAKDDVAALRSFVCTFGDVPLADFARRRLCDRFDAKKDGLSLELLLMRLRQSPEADLAAFATARLIELYLERERYQPVPGLLGDLEKRFAEASPRDGKTGREMAEDWKSDDNVLQLLAGPAAWPERNLEAKRRNRTGNIEQEFAIDFVGPRGALDGWRLALSANRQNLVARDGSGQDRWSLRVDALKDPRRPGDPPKVIPNVIGNSARVHGHLLVVTLGNFFVVVDTLVPGASPQVLWVRDLQETSGAGGNMNGVQIRNIALPGGGFRQEIVDPLQRPLGSVGVVAEDYLCYQVATTLYAADPITGEILWERRNITRGSEVFGDREHVFVVSPGSQQVSVLQSTDGAFVATRTLPAAQSRLIMSGRRVVASRKTADQGELFAVDPVTGQRVWQRTFVGEARVALVKDDEIALLEPRGKFAVLSLADGAAQLEADVSPAADVESIAVLRSADRYLVLTNSPPPAVGRRVQPTNPYMRTATVNGPAWSFDRRTGKPVWSTRIESQQVDLGQPDDLPVLVFSTLRYNFQQPGQFAGNEWAVQLLDVRNGRTVHSEAPTNTNTVPYRLGADASKKTVAIEFYGFALDVSVTETPLLPGELPRSAP